MTEPRGLGEEGETYSRECGEGVDRELCFVLAMVASKAFCERPKCTSMPPKKDTISEQVSNRLQT